jgi:hypothetical protein
LTVARFILTLVIKDKERRFRANIVARPHNAGAASWQGFQISVKGGSELVALPATDVSGHELDVKSTRRLGKSFEADCGPEEGGVKRKSGA